MQVGVGIFRWNYIIIMHILLTFNTAQIWHIIMTKLTTANMFFPNINCTQAAEIDLDLQTCHSEGSNRSSMQICRKSVQRFQRFFIHKQKVTDSAKSRIWHTSLHVVIIRTVKTIILSLQIALGYRMHWMCRHSRATKVTRSCKTVLESCIWHLIYVGQRIKVKELATEQWHKGTNAPSLSSSVVDNERTRAVDDFP